MTVFILLLLATISAVNCKQNDVENNKKRKALVNKTNLDMGWVQTMKPGCLPPGPVIPCLAFNDFCKGNDENCPSGQICCGVVCGTSCKRSVCDVPQSVGPCVNSKRRWYYDQKKMRCRKFDKKGCAANKEVNGFESRKKCRKLTKSCVCLLPKQPGTCRGSFPRYYYNSKSGKCENFIYGGCKGNKNNFRTPQACQRRCGSHPPRPSTPPPPPPPPPQGPHKCPSGIPIHDCIIGPGNRPCQTGYYCVRSPIGGPGSCCPIPCKHGSPHKTLSCGMVASSNKCPPGYHCLGGPADEYFGCCPNGPMEKPGKCPVPTGVGICVEQCSKDEDCKGTQKCCSNGCGHTCTEVLPVVKPGFCPPLPPNTVGHCAELCTGDASCPGTQKCCSNGCGHVCSFPTGGIKPPPCPVGNPLTKTGSSGLVYCGKSPNNQSCPKGYYCNGVMCCQQVCKFGPPLNGIFCGRGSERKDCPKGYSCNIAPNDAYAICCPSG